MNFKKSLGLLATVSVVAAAGWNYQQNKEKVELSDLALANVEALASGESSIRAYQTMGYCTPSSLNYMCTSRHTAESCHHDCP